MTFLRITGKKLDFQLRNFWANWAKIFHGTSLYIVKYYVINENLDSTYRNVALGNLTKLCYIK